MKQCLSHELILELCASKDMDPDVLRMLVGAFLEGEALGLSETAEVICTPGMV